MSVIKTNPSEKIVHRVMEGNATSSKFNSSTFSHKNLIKKIVETAANKKGRNLFVIKSKVEK